ncbi:SDR family oxidoreductase [Adhaeribacter terreus]|uniref:SDR family oxidoreductase n=1 Tax=Adhaeribacter terreus TaxID=529703 RepID=A0ABW0E753_9BACT
MNLKGNTVLITGGASGIGLALAERFLQAGNTVIICGRREDKLNEAKTNFPKLHTRVCDVASETERIALFEWATKEFPDLNVLVNNAGIQMRTDLQNFQLSWKEQQNEIAINFEAPVHLSILFIPFLKKQANPVIINVTSGLAFNPGAFASVYSATKAALHSFTQTLRYQLTDTNINVIEVAPPAVDTDLSAPGLHTFGVPLNEFADAVFEKLKTDELEFGYSTSEAGRKASPEERKQIFNRINPPKK